MLPSSEVLVTIAVAVGPQDPARDRRRHAEVVGVDDQANRRRIRLLIDRSRIHACQARPSQSASCLTRRRIDPLDDDDIPVNMAKRILIADDSVTIQKAFAMTFAGADVT